MFRRAAVTALALTVLLVAADSAQAAPCWLAPVDGTVVDAFREPPCPYCAGNRGLEYRVGSTTSVRAVAAGVVSWAGSIAGTRYVVVTHADGWRATYGKLTDSSLRIGDGVVRQMLVGRASGEFYFGLRVGSDYRDPEPYLGRLVGRPRLVPLDGTTPRRPPAPRLRCGTTG